MYKTSQEEVDARFAKEWEDFQAKYPDVIRVMNHYCTQILGIDLNKWYLCDYDLSDGVMTYDYEAGIKARTMSVRFDTNADTTNMEDLWYAVPDDSLTFDLYVDLNNKVLEIRAEITGD
jgi:hypothetical protein